MKPKLSNPGKMPCKSWSLQALDTCPGSTDDRGQLVAACRGCYATDGNYRFKSVKAVRDHNREAWQDDAFANLMVEALDNDRYFRWFDSGDMYHLRLAEKILEICKRTPWVSHWIPTRMYKFPKFAPVLAELEALPNVVVRYSSDSISGGVIPGRNSSTIVASAEHAPDGIEVCGAGSRGGKCGPCRACWNKKVSVVGYVAHGRKMIKLLEV